MVKKSDADSNFISEDATASANTPNPFVTPNSKNKGQNPTASFHPELPRRVMEIPGGPRRSDNPMSLNNEANKLTVGKNIRLNGEIVACETLVVEGQVEATLRDAQIIEVSEGGCFEGSADVTKASISGKFIGTLVAKELLTIHNGGHVEGSIRYGRIIIEAGGTITGDMASIEKQQS